TNVTWTSSDESVATVDEYGEVTAVKAGTATITAKANDGSNVSATCVVTVKDKAVTPEQPSTTTTTVTPPTTAVVDPAPVGTPATIGKISYVVTGPNSVKLVKNLNKKAKKVTVPATVNVNGKVLPVTEIGNNAFKNNKKLTSVVIGPNVTKIGKNVFKGCKSLKKITVKTKKLNSTSIKNLAKSVKFRGAKLTVKVPKAKKKAYKKIFKKSAKKVKIK
ncbi:MAG: leucine-rich repeat protein, partial [Lachnospiraceae bacterium]|nr:leucine-rich repeat protein [Lachnospiraceae bacterium]